MPKMTRQSAGLTASEPSPWSVARARASIAVLMLSGPSRDGRPGNRSIWLPVTVPEYGLPMATATEAATEARTGAPYLTVAERVARGKAARAEVPRSSQAAFEPLPRRGDPVNLLAPQS